MSGVPILVEAAGIEVLIVGAGAVAARKARTLSEAGARVRVVAPRIGGEVRALADGGGVTLVEREYRAGDVDGATLVIAATDERATNLAVARDARAARRLVNVADAADEGSFSTMAVHRAGELVIGISAGVPAAAARIRDAIAARFDTRYALALRDLAALRRTLLSAGDAPRWQALSTRVIDARFCDAVENGSVSEGLG